MHLEDLLKEVADVPEVQPAVGALVRGLAKKMLEQVGDPNRVLTFIRLVEAAAPALEAAVVANTPAATATPAPLTEPAPAG